MIKSYARASRYAWAFVHVLSENSMMNKFDDYILSFEKIVRKITEDDNYRMLVQSPLIPKEIIIKQIMKSINSDDKILENFIDTIVKKGRQFMLPEILLVMKNIQNELDKKVEVNITTVNDLEDSELSSLKDILTSKTGKNVELKNNKDDSLIGGIQILTGDKFFDYSVKGYLESIKNAYTTKRG
ncbi:MAG TPA: ATP synthase F1 subunit delta [Tepiditoga sp.]|nr:ATP synthase F1 subunit delta [Tepiditoga sp.]